MLNMPFSVFPSLQSNPMIPPLPQDMREAHRVLARYNRERLTPRGPGRNWQDELRMDYEMRFLECEVLDWEKNQIVDLVPENRTSEEFMDWFCSLEKHGPGQEDPLFDCLEQTATLEQMSWFIHQEVAGEAGFDDLTALTQVKLPTRPKLEVARNYWDEMGRGNERGMHGRLLEILGSELGVASRDPNEPLPEALALGNILLGLALNRRYAYHSIGALGVVELTAPNRALKVYRGLKRLGVSPEGQRYYLLHSTLDVKHSQSWNQEVIKPLLDENPRSAQWIAEGALMRLNAGARCFQAYRDYLWVQ